jgi:hypothetical protein
MIKYMYLVEDLRTAARPILWGSNRIKPMMVRFGIVLADTR